jgi:uncharacterized protein
VTAHRPSPNGNSGICSRSAHAVEIAATRPKLGSSRCTLRITWRQRSPSTGCSSCAEITQSGVHGVALSLGSTEELDAVHLTRLKALIERIEPILEHLAWSAISGVYLNDLLSLPYTEESLDIFRRHLDEVQEALGRRLLIENSSCYLRYRHSSIPEPDFLTEVDRRTGCGIRFPVLQSFPCIERDRHLSACRAGHAGDRFVFLTVTLGL